MPRLRPALLLAAVLATCCAETALARQSHARADSAGRYDLYVMALSWSPTFCQTHPDERDQCGHQGYGFVLHGLWPQYENGGGPQRCATDAEPDRATVARALPFMPSRRLINHEWHAHGSCSGLDPAGYFALADRAFATVHAPPELVAPAQDLTMNADALRAALKRANPGLDDRMLSLHCSQGDLVEVRVCLDKDLAPRRCGRRTRTGCPASAPFTIPAAK